MQQKKSQERVDAAAEHLKEVRQQTDEVILSLWNQIEKHFSGYPENERLEECRKYGMIYYYRKSERGDVEEEVKLKKKTEKRKKANQKIKNNV